MTIVSIQEMRIVRVNVLINENHKIMEPKIDNNYLRQLAYLVIIVLGVGYLLYIGASIILPLIFASLFAIFLTPLERKFSQYVKWKWASIFLTFSSIILPLILVGALFSFQLVRIFDSMPSITKGIKQGGKSLARLIDDKLPFLDIQSDNLLMDGMEKAIEKPFDMVGYGLTSTSSILAGIAFTLIYTYLIMYYRKSIKNFIFFQFDKQDRQDVKLTLEKIKNTVQGYVGGVGVVIVILSTVNTIGLWLIGIEYPLFWGTLAGLLSVIPYAGTLLGGLLPFLFAVATADHSWQPWAIVAYYIVIQQIEGNFITPKIVGGRVNINPLFAIISLLIFGMLWGIGGIILALPIISIVRIILNEFDTTESIAALMGSSIAKRPEVFKELADS